MTKQTKFINLADFKATGEGAGGWEGYLSKFGELDDGGDIVAAGAYTDTLDAFLTRGFNAESHDWTFSKMIGYPVSAKEDEVGLYVKSAYHSTPDAQLVRTKAQERIAAGKGVYMSIGYEPAAPPVFILPKDYAAEIPQYSTPDMVQQNLAKAASFPRVRVLPKVELYEGSIVSVPMLRSAEVTSIKSAGIKGAFEVELAEQSSTPWYLWQVFCSVLYDIEQQDEAAEAMMLPFDFAGAVNEAVQEFAARLSASIIAADVAEDQAEAGGAQDSGDMGDMAFMGRAGGQRKRGSLVYGQSFSAGARAVVDAAARTTEWAEKRFAMRTKEGRVFSSANMTELASLHTELNTLVARLDKLLADAKPKPKDGEETPKQLDIQAVLNHLMVMDLQLKGVPIK